MFSFIDEPYDLYNLINDREMVKSVCNLSQMGMHRLCNSGPIPMFKTTIWRVADTLAIPSTFNLFNVLLKQ